MLNYWNSSVHVSDSEVLHFLNTNTITPDLKHGCQPLKFVVSGRWSLIIVVLLFSFINPLCEHLNSLLLRVEFSLIFAFCLCWPTICCVSKDSNTTKWYISSKQLPLANYVIEKGCLPAICEVKTKYNAKDNWKLVGYFIANCGPPEQLLYYITWRIIYNLATCITIEKVLSDGADGYCKS